MTGMTTTGSQRELPSGAAAPALFPETSWTLVARARDSLTAVQRRGLEELLGRYRPVLVRFLTGCRGLAREPAEDLVQGFVADKILEQHLLRRADRARGRFRSFLLKSFTHYVRDQQRRAQALKRAPPGGELPLDPDADAGPATDPRREFDLAWARQVLDTTLERMRGECCVRRREEVWTLFTRRVVAPLLAGIPAPPYESIVAELGLVSPLQASNLLVTAKRMFARLLAATIRETVATDAEVAAEIRALRKILAGDGARSGGRAT